MPLIPMTWGVLRPVVLLPEQAQQWPEPARRLVLLHELAHIKRWDVGFQLIGRLATAVYWFHPLAWYALHRLRAECECACDDYVVHLGARRTDYAQQLVELARSLRAASLTAAVPLTRTEHARAAHQGPVRRGTKPPAPEPSSGEGTARRVPRFDDRPRGGPSRDIGGWAVRDPPPRPRRRRPANAGSGRAENRHARGRSPRPERIPCRSTEGIVARDLYPPDHGDGSGSRPRRQADLRAPTCISHRDGQTTSESPRPPRMPKAVTSSTKCRSRSNARIP